MKIKKLLFYTLNIIYLIIGVGFLFFFYINYLPNSTLYDKCLFTIIVLVYITIVELTNSFVSKILSFIYVSIFGLYLMAQDIYYSVFSQYFRLSYAFSLRNEVNTFKSSAFEFVALKDFVPFIIFGVISILFIIVYFVYQKKLPTYKWFPLIRLSFILLTIPCIFIYNNFNNMLEDTKHQEEFFQLNKTDYYLYDTIYSSNDFVDKFGLITFCYRDVLKANETEDYYQYKDEVTEFLNNKPEHIDNDLTGIFKGKNVMFIQAESYNRYALDPDLTPTIYRMATKGINVKGFDTPALVGSTSDSEFLANVSIIPDSEEYASCYRYIDNKYDLTLASIFKNAGYLTESFHNCYGTYYNRDLLFTSQFGYDTFRDCTDMGKEDTCDDYDYGANLYWMYDNAQRPFMAYWITYSGHQPYSLDSVGVKSEYVNQIKEKYPNLDDEHVAYLAKNMDLDRSIESILVTAEYLNRQDDLVIVFFGDHVAKGLDMDGKGQTELYIYCPGNELSLEYEKPSTCLDILPTIANMFGLEYDYNKVLGRDLFDDSYHGYCFSSSFDFITGDYKCNSKGEIVDNNGNLIDDEQVISETNRYFDYKRISKIIQKLDYFKQN